MASLVLAGLVGCSKSSLQGPRLEGVSPAHGTSLGGTPITLTGSHLRAPLQVEFDGSSASVTSSDIDTVTCVLPPGTPGASVDVEIANANGADLMPGVFRYHELPQVLSLSTAAGSPLGGTSTIVTGSGFEVDDAGANLVRFGGATASNVVVVDDTTLTCDTPVGVGGTTVDVEVSNANGADVLSGGFSYFPEPALTSVTAPAGTSLGGTSVTINGTGFVANAAGAATVTFDGVPATGVVIVDDTTLTCETPAGAPGTVVDVVLANDNGASTLAGGFTFHPTPTVVSVAPGAGTSLGSTAVTLGGSGFLALAAGTNTVTFAGVPAADVVVVDDTTLTCETPPGAEASAADVAVSNANGTGTASAGYAYHPLPTLTAVAADHGTALGGDTVTLAGSGFLVNGAGANAVTFDGAAAASVIVVDDTTIQCTAPAGTGGARVDVVVSNLNGAATLGAGYRYHALPEVASVSPPSGSPLGGLAVTVTGTGFLVDQAGTSTVLFDGVPATGVTVVDDTTITCVTPVGPDGAAVDVQVSNDNGAGTLSAGFIYHSTPFLASVTPSAGTSLGGTTVTVSGAGFVSNGAGPNSVTFGGVSAVNVTVVGENTITCDTPAAAPGSSVDVTVSNANGSATLTGGYAYHPLPTLTAVAPSSGTSLGGTTVTLTGSGFLDHAPGTNSVTFDGNAAASVVVVDDATITCEAPPGVAATTVDVVVANTNGSAGLAGSYAYHALPTLTAVAPAAGTSLGGTAVTLTGTGFSNDAPGANTVTFDGAAASGIVVVDDTTITCQTPPGTAGASVDVVLTNANGTAVLVAGYAYHPLPTLTAVAPTSGTSLGGTAVTLTGTGFLSNAPGATAVTFGGSAATSIVVVDDTTATCTAPAATAGSTVDVALANANGTAVLAGGYAYHALPTLTSLVPPSGTSLGGTTLTLTGTGFLNDGAGTNTVTVGGSAAGAVAVVDDTTITCEAPSGSPGATVDVVVRNDNGSATLAGAYTYHALPTLSALAPTSGSALGGTAVTLTGSGFLDDGPGPNAVTFGGNPASGIVVVDDTTITCTTPPGTRGTTVSVELSNANGSATLVGAFSYFPQPTLGSVSPSAGTSLGNRVVSLNGSGFVANGAGANGVTFGGVPATNVVVQSDSSLTCTLPAGAAGASVDVTVSNANGSATLPGGFTYHPHPVVTSIAAPSSSQAGGITVTVTGSGFLANAAGTNSVSFGGLAATTIIIYSDSSLTCRVPAGTAGTTVDVTVSNANGPGTLSGGFLYHAEPTVLSVTPAAGSSLGGTVVAIGGSGFQTNAAGAPSVTFGGQAATGVSVLDDATIQCTVPAGTPGTSVAVVVANANGSGELAGGYTYHATPSVSGVAPASGTSLGGTNVTITGGGFSANAAGTCTVTFAGAAATNVTVVDDATITCDTPPGSSGASVTVTVSNANGSSSLAGAYSYFAAPTIASVTPASGRWQGGTNLTIIGTGFVANGAGANAVTIEGAAATSVVVVDDTTLTCTSPAGSPGIQADVVVSNANGSATASNAYRYYSTPAVTSVSPAAGTSLGGTAVTLTGSGFLVDSPGPSSVTMGGAAATSVNVVDDATITCITPAGTPATDVDVVVGNANGSATRIAGFRYHAEPDLLSISPAEGAPGGGTRVTLSGTGFLANGAGTNVLSFGGSAVTNLVVINDTTLTCDAPAGAAGTTVDVALQNANGADMLAGAFAFHPPPVLASIAPTSGTSLGGTVVVLTGTGFLDNAAGANTVTFGGLAATEVVVFSDTSMRCEAPAGAPGSTVDVELSNNNGSAGLTAAFTYHPQPTLTTVTPNAVSSLGGTSVTLTGTGFTANTAGAPSVTFGGAAGTSIVAVDDTTITCDVPAGASGSAVDVVVDNINGSATLAGGLAYHAEPTLTGIAPASGTSLGGTAVTLTGTGFLANTAGAATVTFDGVAAGNVAVVDDTTITCDTPAGNAGTVVDVALSNANGSALLAGGFRYHALPTLTGVSPAAGSPAGGTSVTLTGSGFLVDAPGTNGVTFGGVAATSVTVVDDATITCDAPSGTAGTFVDVALSNDNGGAGLTNAFSFYAEPTLSAVTPDHGAEAGSAAVTLTGTGFLANFAGACSVTFDGLAATAVVVVNDTTITCSTPAGTAGPGVDVAVSNANGSATLVGGYTYHPPPTLASVAPASGPAAGSTSVTVTGSGFQANGAGTNAVSIGGAAATSVVVVDDSTITCLTPTGSAGSTVDVAVTNINGSVTLSGGFTYHALPTLSAVAPAFGSAAGGTTVTLTGTGFTTDSPGTHGVTFDGIPAVGIAVVNDTTLTCDTPAGSADSTVDVVVSNDNGSATLVGGYDYNDPPTFTAIGKQWAEDGVAFAFTPSIAEPDASDVHTFSSTGTALPGWVTLNPSTGALSGTPGPGDVGLTSGVELSVDDGFHLVASNTFELEVSGVATQLVFGTAPAASEAQDEPWTAFTVRVEDASSNLVGTWSGSVTLNLASGTGSLSGTLVQPVVDGIATFDDVRYDTAEAITFDLTAPGLTGILGTAMTVNAGPATKLAFAVQPSAVEYRDVNFASVVVEVRDASGMRITSDNTTQVDLVLHGGAGTLIGTLSRTASAGRAIFDDISYDLAETIQLRASSVPASTSPTSDPTLVRGNPPTSLPQVRASVDSLAAEATGASAGVAVSANGRFLAFDSVASDLVAGDTNGVSDVFVHDRVSGETTRVSLGAGAAQANGASSSPAISADGRFVAFESVATNLVAGDTNAVSDVFIHDRESGATFRVSVDSAGAQATGASHRPALSASGLRVAFESTAADLVPGDTNGVRDVFVHERVTGVTKRVSVDSLAAEADAASFAPVLSADGLTAGFHSTATNLVAGDTNGALDVFVHELASGQTTRVSVDSVGAQAGADSSLPSLSADGSVVAFASLAGDLVAGDTNAVRDVFVHDRGSGQTIRVSVDSAGGEADGASDRPALSHDGQRVLFSSTATGLMPGDDEGFEDVFLHVRSTGRTRRLSTAAAGGGGNGASNAAALSGDGRHAAFASTASDLVAGDANGVSDAFLRPIRSEPTASLVSPTQGSSLGGTALTLTGAGFANAHAGGNAVFIDGNPAGSVVTVNDATITCTAPAGAAGATVDVVIVNNNGFATVAGAYTYRSTPTVSSVAPAVGAAAGGTSVTVSGSGFTSTGFGSNAVTFGGVAATDVVTLGDATITCTAPAGTPGASVDVVVTNLNGSGTLSAAFSYHPAPGVVSVSPASGHASGGDTITIGGTGFQANGAGNATVTFGGVTAGAVVVVDDTTITCSNPSGAVGATVDVTVSNSNGSATLPASFLYNPAPVLTAVAPAAGSPLGGTRLTLTGSGFLNNSTGTTTVTVGGSAATNVVVVDDGTVTCDAPAGAPQTSVGVRITNGNGTSLLAGSYTFNARPTLTSIAPAAGTSLGARSVTLGGSGFSNTSSGVTAVSFGGVAATDIVVVSDGTVTCTTPAGPAASAVDVVLSDGNGTSLLASAYSYFPTPTLASVSPSGGALTGGTTITLSGTGFVANAAGACTVSVGGNPATLVVVLNNTTIRCTTPAGSTGGPADIVVTNDNGEATLSGGFLYNAAPTVTAVVPAAGTSLGTTAVTITGAGFVANGAGVNSVTFDGVAATRIVAVDNGTITCDTPAGTAGAAVDVVVSNANGAGVLSGGFAYHPTPTVASVVPAAGTANGGTGVTVSGSGFVASAAGINTVRFAGVPAANVVVVDDSTLTCTTPVGAAGTSVDVEVTNANGQGSLVAAYAYHPAPTLSSASPAAGSALGGTTVTLVGSGFSLNAPGTNTVTFGGASAGSVVVVDDTTITCSAPAGSAGAVVDVALVNANGSAALASAFTYHPAPTLTGVSPAGGTSLGGTAVTLSGTGFVANAAGTGTVTFGGVPATGVAVVDDTTITCTVPAGTPAASVTVAMSNANGAASLAGGFTYHPLPTVASVVASQGSSLGGLGVTLHGTGFSANGAGTNTVTFARTPATGVVVIDDTTLTCDTPAGTPGSTTDVAVTNSNGTGVRSNAFAYHPAPSIASISPDRGSALGSTVVTISGTGFLANDAGVNTLRFGGVEATNVVVVDDTTLTCSSPPGAGGAAVIVEVANGNGTATAAAAYTYHSSPTVTAVSPAAGTSLGGTSITITGTGFVADGAGSNTVTVAGAAASSIAVVNDTTITCVTPPGAAASAADVVVGNANGTGTLAGGFAYHPQPSVSSVSPAGGPAAGGTALSVSGSGFTSNSAGTTVLSIAGAAAVDVVVVDDTTITCTAPPGTPGSPADLVASNANGTGTLVGGYAYHPLPRVTGVSPAAGSSLGGVAVTVTGAGFAANAPGTNAITFGGVAATNVVVLDDSTITCDTPAGTPATSVDLQVQNANGSALLPAAFDYHPTPGVTGVTPASGTSLGGTSITITGTGFVVDGAGSNTVTVGGAQATGVVAVDDSTITCDTPAGSAGATVTVAVSNANGTGSLAGGFGYHAGPTLSGVTPGSATSLGGTRLSLSGSGFLVNQPGINTVSFDGALATSVTVVDDTTLTCDAPAGSPGFVLIDVTNENGLATLAGAFQYHPRPSIGAVLPAAGPPSGGNLVTLTGTGFAANAAGANTVTFDGAAATNVTVLDDTSLACDVPSGTPATDVDVVVTNANGAGTLSAGYRYRSDVAVDIDDDRIADVLVGAPGAGSGSGAAYVFLGASGISDQAAGAAHVSITTGQGAAELGRSVAVGDLDGDGAADLVVGAPGIDSVFVFFGPLTSPAALTSASADVAIAGAAPGHGFGHALAIGDVDGDGIDDLIVGAPRRGSFAEGSAYVFLGGAGFAPSTAGNADHELQGASGEAFGTALIVGDVNADTVPDLAVGAPGTDRVCVFFGGGAFAGGPSSAADAKLDGEVSGDAFGAALAAGDVTGDGFVDLVVGAPSSDATGADSGSAYVFAGGVGFGDLGAASAAAIVTGEGPGDGLGGAAACGDFDGDGTSELLLGADGWDLDGTTTDVGRAYLLLGGALPPWANATSATARFSGESFTGEAFARALACDDLDDDGRADLIVGAPGNGGAGAGAGRVYVFLGTATPADRSAGADDATFTGAAAGDGLGGSLAER